MREENKAYSGLIKEFWGSPGFWNVKKTYVELAAVLGNTEQTFRSRIKLLKANRFLLAWRLVPNLLLLTRKLSFLLLEGENPASKEKIVSRLKAVDDSQE